MNSARDKGYGKTTIASTFFNKNSKVALKVHITPQWQYATTLVLYNMHSYYTYIFPVHRSQGSLIRVNVFNAHIFPFLEVCETSVIKVIFN